MAARSTRIGGRNPEQACQAAWLATEKVVRPSTRPERHLFPAFRSCASSARFASDASRAPCPLSSTPQNAELFTLTTARSCARCCTTTRIAWRRRTSWTPWDTPSGAASSRTSSRQRPAVRRFQRRGRRRREGWSAHVPRRERARGWNEDETECRVVLESIGGFRRAPGPRTSATARCSAASCAAPWRRSVDGASRRQGPLRGDDRFELRLRHVEMIEDEYPFDDASRDERSRPETTRTIPTRDHPHNRSSPGARPSPRSAPPPPPSQP